MDHTIEMVVNGDDQVLLWFALAKRKWDIEGVDLLDSKKLANIAYSEQFWFEENCGPGSHDRWVGQEVMVVSAIFRFYDRDSGFHGRSQKQAQAMYRALASSSNGCSVEIRGVAKDIGKIHPALACK
jgi:hypothetical protein